MTQNIRSTIIPGMSLLRRIIEALLHRKNPVGQSRVFLQDAELIAVIQDVARQQQRPEEEIVADFTKVGLDQFRSQSELESRWAALSRREQQVVALVCLGYRNYEIAKILVIAPDTVKTHLQSIFYKFDLHSGRELRLALKHWNFDEWWDKNRQD